MITLPEDWLPVILVLCGVVILTVRRWAKVIKWLVVAITAVWLIKQVASMLERR